MLVVKNKLEPTAVISKTWRMQSMLNYLRSKVEKVGVEAATACNKYNDLRSHDEIKEEYKSVKKLIEKPTENAK